MLRRIQTPRPRPWAPTLGRSLRLFADFRHEQDDPRRFYTALAADSVGQLGVYADLDGATVLDVGGGPGYFRDTFTAAGAAYVALDADVGELSGQGEIAPGTVIGDGMRLPFADDSVDVCYSSNVLEHVPDRARMAEEMLRVTRPGGIVFLSYTLWWGPWGGHETSPWHLLGGRYARRRYLRTQGREPKNRFGESMYAVTAAEMLRWSGRQQRAQVLLRAARYHPRWARWIVRVPLVGEVLSWNLLLVLRKR
ncbi:Methyltransferase domain-containing protein [Nocardioides terrae]|uniref:Methyltransferase domain-containing protein n=1 Tax=Nocardioides terrae TaxID=574651 RepID=A0A1I1FYI6_9ACTN|nr:class I SAM-dependent methyltransferase [Nocardioides terrae]SFC02668.1 Methyltransferase domain-containing protein [Nocardioides terrae]